MRITAAAILILVTGCADEAALAPRFSVAEVSVSEDTFPVAIQLHFKNEGSAPADIDGLRIRYTYSMPLYDEDAVGWLPKGGFKGKTTLLAKDGESFRVMGEDEWVPVKPGETRTIYGALAWDVPPDAAPMLTIVGCQLVLMQADKELIATEPFIVVLESRPGSLALVEQAVHKNAHQLPGLVKLFKGLKGAPSPRFRDLVLHFENMLADSGR